MKNIVLVIFFSAMCITKVKAQTTPYLGQIIYTAFDRVPVGWAACNGQLLPISQNGALFQLIGTTYGGDGQTTFALPNTQGKVLLGTGQSNLGTNFRIGQTGGEEQHTLTINEMPQHTHSLLANSNEGTTSDPTGAFLANTGKLDPEYSNNANDNQKVDNNKMIVNTGGSMPHNNMQPFVTFKCIIALQGIYPTQ